MLKREAGVGIEIPAPVDQIVIVVDLKRDQIVVGECLRRRGDADLCQIVGDDLDHAGIIGVAVRRIEAIFERRSVAVFADAVAVAVDDSLRRRGCGWLASRSKGTSVIWSLWNLPIASGRMVLAGAA